MRAEAVRSRAVLQSRLRQSPGRRRIALHAREGDHLRDDREHEVEHPAVAMTPEKEIDRFLHSNRIADGRAQNTSRDR